MDALAGALLPAGVAQHVRRVAAERLTRSSPELWMALLPVAAYWFVAALYDVLDHLQLPVTERFRIRSEAEREKRNSRSRSHVVLRVLVQHIIQVSVSIGLVFVDPEMCDTRRWRGWLSGAPRFLLGMIIMDGWQYFIHRAAHESKLMYNAVHSHHHRLLVCYAYGALYNHPLEALLLDTLGGVVSMYGAGLSCGGAAALWTFGTLKTVFDHSGYMWPINPVAPFFANNALYHDVHHDPRGFRKNYSQPFFTFWDRMLGTYMDPAEIHGARIGGGKGQQQQHKGEKEQQQQQLDNGQQQVQQRQRRSPAASPPRGSGRAASKKLA